MIVAVCRRGSGREQAAGGQVTAPGACWPSATVQLTLAGVGSVLPAASRARTWTVWAPAGRFEYVLGETHGPKAPPSSRHSMVEPGSDEAAMTVAALFTSVPAGPLADVSGAVVSTIHVRVAGLASVLPSASFARTWNVCCPCARFV